MGRNEGVVCFALLKLMMDFIALPDLFINVRGLARIIFLSLIMLSEIRELNFLYSLNSGKLFSSAKLLIILNPILCRVNSYFFPGFPSPAIIIIV